MITHLWLSLNRFLDKVASFLSDPFLLAVRLYWGWQFFVAGKAHFENLDKTTEFFASLNIPFPKLNVFMAAGTECVGGLLLLIGLFSRVVTLPLMATMVVAYLTADIDKVKGIFGDSDAFVTAAPFLFLFASLVVFIFGPGRLSVDGLLAKRRVRVS